MNSRLEDTYNKKIITALMTKLKYKNKHEVPEVLISGHHEKIKKWRKEKSVEKTKLNRPDLLKTEQE